MRFLLAAMILTVAGACAPEPRGGGDILVIGDSVMAWNREANRDVGNAIATELDRNVVSRAASGALVTANDVASLFRLSIPDQLPPGQWNWVVANGTANDLGLLCRCNSCNPVIDNLISEDGMTGHIPDLIEKAQSQGARVVWLGYYVAPEATAFKGCRPFLVEAERRIEELSLSRNGFFFLDAEDIFDPPARELFDPDRTHPSPKGSALIGKGIAELIANES